jgi:hypothetical protein
MKMSPRSDTLKVNGDFGMEKFMTATAQLIFLQSGKSNMTCMPELI